MNFMKTQEKDFRVFNVKNTEDYTVIYVKNATEGLNLLAHSLGNKKDYIISTRMEHHANDLPWRENSNILYVEVDELGLLKKKR